jgi:3-methyladenine DNA glycosylase AlkD
MASIPRSKTAPRNASASQTSVDSVLAQLERAGTARYRDGLSRYGIVAPKAFGVSVGALRSQARKIGRDHALAVALWKSGWYEARMLATLVEDPGLVSPAQMDRWCRDFDNWAICDTACFHLFDRSPHAWRKIAEWAKRSDEFQKRAAFALLASVAAHDKTTADGPFLKSLPLIEHAARDERNFVKKGVSWALRAVGHRSPALHASSVKLAQRLASSSDKAARWVGTDALRDLTRPMVLRKLAKKRRAR